MTPETLSPVVATILAALIGGISGVAGTLVAQYFAIRLERRRWDREDEDRSKLWDREDRYRSHEDRRRAYARFARAAAQFLIQANPTADLRPLQVELGLYFQEIGIMAPTPVREAAATLYDQLGYLAVNVHRYDEIAALCRESLNRFGAAARADVIGHKEGAQ